MADLAEIGPGPWVPLIAGIDQLDAHGLATEGLTRIYNELVGPAAGVVSGGTVEQFAELARLPVEGDRGLQRQTSRVLLAARIAAAGLLDYIIKGGEAVPVAADNHMVRLRIYHPRQQIYITKQRDGWAEPTHIIEFVDDHPQAPTIWLVCESPVLSGVSSPENRLLKIGNDASARVGSMAFATHLYSRYREGRDPAPRSIRYLTRGKLEQSWRSEHDMDRLIRFQLRLADELQWLSNIAIDLAVG